LFRKPLQSCTAIGQGRYPGLRGPPDGILVAKKIAMASNSKQEWRETTLASTLKRAAERQAKFETSSGLEIEPVYTPEDLASFDYARDSGYPGEYPFTRGVQANMYRGRIWTIRQYAGFGTAEETNQRYRYLLEQGQTGLSIAFDLPTQIGYDSDHPLARGEVGKVGVAIDSLRDMEVLFQDIPLDKVSTSMTINATAPGLLAMYIALGKKQGVEPAGLNGTTQNDILKEYIARGTYIFPPRPSLRLTTDIFAYCAEQVPRWNTISISGYHIREAGSTAAQEIGFTLANGIAYVQAAMNAGLAVDTFAPRLSFFFNSHVNFLEEIAKFRAARRLWARIMRERFEAKDSRSWMLRFHTQTAGCSLTAQQPHNNIIRTALQALAATLGGTQSLHTNSFDEAYAPPSEEAVTVAVRTQQILGYESGIADIVDPLGGSYYLEHLTDSLEEQARQYINAIDELGGAAQAIEQGYQQREIQDASYRYQKEIESSARTVVGVNKFVSPYPKITGLLRVNPAVEARQRQRTTEVRRGRDNDYVNQTLRRLEDAARSTDNTMPAFLECAEAYATLGEMCDVLRRAYGTQKEFLVF
jgi:methylmalonyl-CoA mutase, N-terminal domain